MSGKAEQQNMHKENLQNRIFPFPARRFFITILHTENGHFCGEINNLFYEESIPFNGLDSAILKMDKMMDVLGSPQAATILRSFQPHKCRKQPVQGTNCLQQERERRYQYYLNKKFMELKTAHTPQIQIEVLYRQNTTWQGTVLFATAKNPRKENFRSVLELINLIHSGCQYYNILHSKCQNGGYDNCMECDDPSEDKSESER